MAAKKNEVAETTQAQVPATAAGYSYGDDQGSGFEGTTGADLSIPFLGVLQSNSQQVEDENPPGAKAGMLYNTVTRELLDGAAGVPFLPVHKEHAFVEWIPRDAGGGFVGLHEPGSEIVKKAIAANGGQKFGKLVLADGHELIETHYVYGLTLEEDLVTTNGFAVLSFSSTKIKPCRDWFTAMYTLKGRPPLFANRARLRTTKQKNEKGSFFNFQLEPARETWIKSLINPVAEAALLTEAKEFRDMVTSGMARASYETQNATGDAGAGGPAPNGDEAPF